MHSPAAQRFQTLPNDRGKLSVLSAPRCPPALRACLLPPSLTVDRSSTDRPAANRERCRSGRLEAARQREVASGTEKQQLGGRSGCNHALAFSSPPQHGSWEELLSAGPTSASSGCAASTVRAGAIFPPREARSWLIPRGGYPFLRSRPLAQAVGLPGQLTPTVGAGAERKAQRLCVVARAGKNPPPPQEKIEVR